MTLPISMSCRRRRTNDNLEKRGDYIRFERAEEGFSGGKITRLCQCRNKDTTTVVLPQPVGPATILLNG